MKNNRFAFFVGALCVLGVSWDVISMEEIPSKIRQIRKQKYIQTKQRELEQANQKLAQLKSNLKEKLTLELSKLIWQSKQAQDEKSSLEETLKREGLSQEEKSNAEMGMKEVDAKISSSVDQIKVRSRELAQIERLRKEIADQQEIVSELKKLIKSAEATLPQVVQKPQPEQQVPEESELESELEPEPEPAATFKLPRGKIGAVVLTAAVLAAAVKTYLNWRTYTKRKQALIKKYKLAKLTSLQNKIWMATALASYGISRYLRYLIKNNSGSLTDFVGADPRALAELYYGDEPTENQVREFITKYFGGVQ